jgi:hypothetical protein
MRNPCSRSSRPRDQTPLLACHYDCATSPPRRTAEPRPPSGPSFFGKQSPGRTSRGSGCHPRHLERPRALRRLSHHPITNQQPPTPWNMGVTKDAGGQTPAGRGRRPGRAGDGTCGGNVHPSFGGEPLRSERTRTRQRQPPASRTPLNRDRIVGSTQRSRARASFNIRELFSARHARR